MTQHIPLAKAGMFKIIWPYTQWVTPQTILQLHSNMIACNIIPASKRTEIISQAIADLQDIGEYRFE